MRAWGKPSTSHYRWPRRPQSWLGGRCRLQDQYAVSLVAGSVGDYIQTQFNYTQGALRYVFQTPNSNHGINDGSQASFGVLSDGVFGGLLYGTAAGRHLGDRRRIDHSMERQRGLRALLEPALADVTVRRLRESGLTAAKPVTCCAPAPRSHLAHL